MAARLGIGGDRHQPFRGVAAALAMAKIIKAKAGGVSAKIGETLAIRRRGGGEATKMASSAAKSGRKRRRHGLLSESENGGRHGENEGISLGAASGGG
jgi:hypothetical protein